MLAGDLGRLGTARINHHHFATARLNGFQSFGDVRYGHHATVGGNRVAAENQEIIGVVNVRNRNHELVTEHQERGELLWQLINRGR